MRPLIDVFRAGIIWITDWILARLVFPSGIVEQYSSSYYNDLIEFFQPTSLPIGSDYMAIMSQECELLLMVNIVIFLFWYTLPIFMPVHFPNVPRKARSIWFMLSVASIAAAAAFIALSPQLFQAPAAITVGFILIFISLTSFYLVSCLSSPPAFKYLVPGSGLIRRRARNVLD